MSENSSLSKSNPNLQLAWDSTSMGELKTCPRKYQLRILEGWSPKQLNVHLHFGLAFHSSLEAYDHALASGADREGAIRMAVREALRATWNSKLKRPWMSENKYKNRETLLRTVVWYLEHFAEDPIETVTLANGKPAVELSFRMALEYESPNDGPYLLCGHLDRVGRLAGNNYIIDRKTTKSQLGGDFFKQFSPHNQFSTYLWAGQHVLEEPIAGLICDAAQVLIEGSRFWREPIQRTKSELEEWIKDFGFWLRTAEFYAEEGHWPMNDSACGNYGGCPFRDVCNKPKSLQEQYLKMGFEKRIWDPLAVRGDI